MNKQMDEEEREQHLDNLCLLFQIFFQTTKKKVKTKFED